MIGGRWRTSSTWIEHVFGSYLFSFTILSCCSLFLKLLSSVLLSFLFFFKVAIIWCSDGYRAKWVQEKYSVVIALIVQQLGYGQIPNNPVTQNDRIDYKIEWERKEGWESIVTTPTKHTYCYPSYWPTAKSGHLYRILFLNYCFAGTVLSSHSYQQTSSHWLYLLSHIWT